jgi:peptide/nickel transport system substrate-binding protein
LDQSGGCCWFAEYYGNQLGHLDPISGTFQEWTIPTINANPYGLAITSIAGEPVLWGTEFSSDKVFAFYPVSGIFREYSLPYYNTGVGFISIEPPSTQVRIWFTETLRNGNGEFVYDQTTGNVTFYEDTFPATVGGGANGLYAGSSSVWFAGFSALVRWDRASQQYTMWPLPEHGSDVLGRFVTVDSYGDVWYTQGASNGTSNDNFVGVLRGNGLIQEWRLPNSGADARQISLNPVTKQSWIAERSPVAGNGTIAVLSDPYGGTLVPSPPTTAPSGGTPITLAPKLTQVNPSVHVISPIMNQTAGVSREQFTEFGLGAVQPYNVLADSKGDVWVSEPAANKIVRISQTSSDFSLTSSLPAVSVRQGGSESVELTGDSIAGFEGAVTFASTTTPPGVGLTFVPNPVSIPSGANASTNVIISAAPTSTPGTSSVTIQGSSGSSAHFLGLLLTITNSTTATSAANAPKTACLVAATTYGSELSPTIQLLRNFRDNSLAKTKTGSSFLIIFNAWYYSFSPSVANYVAAHELTRAGMKSIFYPIIADFYLTSKIYNSLSSYPEAATIIAGLTASSLIGVLYIGLPLWLVARRLKRRLNFKEPFALLLTGLATILVGLTLSSTILLMISTSLTVLVTIFTSGVAVTRVFSLTLILSRPKRVESFSSLLRRLHRFTLG